ncbi:MAG: transcriptional regulator [Chloroflexi bacterium]|nr:transcriptional regulator [Chloroflexota bacterium]MDL1912458.1 YafY family transcriptional regulator [Chloroflexi bacterium CFX6]
MPNTATRLITLIFLLQNQPNQKASELAEKLGVSLRTVHRYFEMLDEMGIPVYSERGPYGGFSLVRGYKMPPLVFTLEEAVAVVLGTGLVQELWGDLYREAARGALAKLENLLPEEQVREVTWARGSLAATGMHRADLKAQTPILEKLRRAIRERRSVDMKYQSSQVPHPSKRGLDPYALVHRWGWWYAIGFCHVHREVRTFRVDRISEISLLETTFSIPPEFDLHEHLKNELQAQPQVNARLRFEAEFAHLTAGNQSYWRTVEPQADGSVEVTFHAPTLEWAASTALAYGPAVEVLEPPELRRMAADWLAAAGRKYS